MPINVIDTIKPKNGGSFPIVEAADVLMPDGKRLSEGSTGAYPVKPGAAEIEPEVFYSFGEVDSLTVTLLSDDDGKAHEYCFEFIPSENFTGLTVTPEPRWAGEPQFAAGKTCQVSIFRGIGVSVSA